MANTLLQAHLPIAMCGLIISVTALMRATCLGAITLITNGLLLSKTNLITTGPFYIEDKKHLEEGMHLYSMDVMKVDIFTSTGGGVEIMTVTSHWNRSTPLAAELAARRARTDM